MVAHAAYLHKTDVFNRKSQYNLASLLPQVLTELVGWFYGMSNPCQFFFFKQ